MGRAHAKGRGEAVRVCLVALGLGCWAATLLVFSVANTPFQRFPGLQDFIRWFPRLLALCSCVACAAVVGQALAGRFMSGRALALAAGMAHVGGCSLFVWMASEGLSGLDETSRWALAVLLAAVEGTGEALVTLEWGRAVKRLGLRGILAAVSLSGIVFAGLSRLLAAVPEGAVAPLFAGLALAACALPAVLGMDGPLGAPQGGDGAAEAASQGRAPSGRRTLALLGVSAPALTGLVFFAYAMALMGGQIVSLHDQHLGMLLAASLLLLALALPNTGRPLLAIAYQRVLPVCAVLLLAVSSIAGLLGGDGGIDMRLVLLLYYVAALVSLGILGAVAHADEFPSDLVVALALGAFCGVTFIGFMSRTLRASYPLSVMAVTTLYAAAMVAIATGRPRLDGDDVLDTIEGAGRPGARGAGPRPGDARRSLEARCAGIAEAYRLTEREAKVLPILAEGHTCNYVAEALYISPSTARTHAHNIYAKLGVASREELMARVSAAPPRP